MKVGKTLLLNTGAQVPVVGLGTWKSSKEVVGEAVSIALVDCGYKHVDCAPIYGNEKEIGRAFKEVFSQGKVRRDEIFITSKLWNSTHARDDVRPACQQTLNDLQLDYLDLYLMHWGIATPLGESEPLDNEGVLMTSSVSVRETWEAMESLVEEGLVKAIGTANFTTAMVIDLLSYAKVKPAINQIELHPYFQQKRLVDFCKRQGIHVTAYSPLGRPQATAPRPYLQDEEYSSHVIEDEGVGEISRIHNKTPAQVLIRWAIQRGTIVIPKSVHPERIRENIDVFDFELSEADMIRINGLERGKRIVNPFGWWKIPYFD